MRKGDEPEDGDEWGVRALAEALNLVRAQIPRHVLHASRSLLME
jgi:hypothetical protein